MFNVLFASNSNSTINKPVFIILLVSSITLLFFSLLEFIIFCINQKFSLFKKKSFDLKTILINLAIICLSILVLAILLIHFFDADDKSKLFLLITWSLTIFLFIFSFLFKFVFIKFLNKNKYDQSDLSQLPLNEILRKFKLEKYINFDFNLLNSNDKWASKIKISFFSLEKEILSLKQLKKDEFKKTLDLLYIELVQFEQTFTECISLKRKKIALSLFVNLVDKLKKMI